MIGPLLGLVAVSFVVSLALSLAAVRVGSRRGLLDGGGSAGHTKSAVRRVPNIGGVAIFWAIAAPMALGIVGAWLVDASWLARVWPAGAEHLDGARASAGLAWALLGCLATLHVLGLIDDRAPLGPALKLGVMIGCALVVSAGFDVRLLELLDGVMGGGWLGGRGVSVAVTVLWFVAVTNAMNFMDNMDGVSAGTGLVASALFLVTAARHGQWFVSAALCLLCGALAGFLVLNGPWPRARLFMGDGGSLVLGFLLAFLTVRTTYYGIDADPVAEGVGASGGGWYAVLMPLCVLALPLYDLVVVSALRLAQGRSPMVGDEQHFTHRLRRRGLTDRGVLAVCCLLTAVTGVSGVALGGLSGPIAALAGAQVVLVLVLIGVLERGAVGGP